MNQRNFTNVKNVYTANPNYRPIEDRIIDYLIESGCNSLETSITATELAKGLGCKSSNLRKALPIMHREKRIKRLKMPVQVNAYHFKTTKQIYKYWLPTKSED